MSWRKGLALRLLLGAALPLVPIVAGGKVPATPTNTTIFVIPEPPNGSGQVFAYRQAPSGGYVLQGALATNLPDGIALDLAGNIYTANFNNSTVSIYAPQASGLAKPLAVIGGPATGLDYPTGVTVDESGKIYVCNTGVLAGSGSVTVYAKGADGNATPIFAVQGPATGLIYPVSISLDSSGDIYIGNHDLTPAPGQVGSILAFSAPHIASNAGTSISGGNVAPFLTISGANTGLISPNSMAFDSKGNLYVTDADVGDDGKTLVRVFAPGISGNVAPNYVIRDGSGQADISSNGIAIDGQDNVYITQKAFLAPQAGTTDWPTVGAAIFEFPAGSQGATTPIAKVQGRDFYGSTTGLYVPQGIALDRHGNFYVANQSGGSNFGGSITIYSSNSSGDVEAANTILMPDPGNLELSTPMATDASGNFYAITLYPYLNGESPSLASYSLRNGLGAVAPATQIPISSARAIASDGNGRLYVEGLRTAPCPICVPPHTAMGYVDVYPKGSTGNATPIGEIALPYPYFGSPVADGGHARIRSSGIPG
jgi:sugar lactone lactonase YvrE